MDSNKKIKQFSPLDKENINSLYTSLRSIEKHEGYSEDGKQLFKEVYFTIDLLMQAIKKTII